MTEDNFNKYKKKVFDEAIPSLKFKPRKDNYIDKKIAKIIKFVKIVDIPIVHVKESVYFVGLYKVRIEIKGDYLLVMVGQNNWERLSQFLKQSRDYFVKCLTLFSLKNNNMSITDVVKKLISLEYIEGITNSYMTNLSYISRHTGSDGNMSLNQSARSASLPFN